MSNRIEEIRRAKRLSMEALALAIGTTASTVNKLEKGQMRLTDKWIAPIARALGVTPGELFDRSESAGIGFAEPGNRFIPVFGLAAGAVRGNHRMDNDPVEHLLAPPALAHVRDAYALIVTGTSMEPRYYSGEVVFIHPHRPVRGGDHVVLQERLDGGTTAVLGSKRTKLGWLLGVALLVLLCNPARANFQHFDRPGTARVEIKLQPICAGLDPKYVRILRSIEDCVEQHQLPFTIGAMFQCMDIQYRFKFNCFRWKNYIFFLSAHSKCFGVNKFIKFFLSVQNGGNANNFSPTSYSERGRLSYVLRVPLPLQLGGAGVSRFAARYIETLYRKNAGSLSSDGYPRSVFGYERVLSDLVHLDSGVSGPRGMRQGVSGGPKGAIQEHYSPNADNSRDQSQSSHGPLGVRIARRNLGEPIPLGWATGAGIIVLSLLGYALYGLIGWIAEPRQRPDRKSNSNRQPRD